MFEQGSRLSGRSGIKEVQENLVKFVICRRSRTTDQATVAVMLFQLRSMMSYFDWIFSIYFVIFKLKTFAYNCINHDSDGAE